MEGGEGGGRERVDERRGWRKGEGGGMERVEGGGEETVERGKGWREGRRESGIKGWVVEG